MTDPFVVPEQLRRDVGVLTGWIRHVGTVLIVIVALNAVVVAGVMVSLVGVRAALDNQDASRERDRCTITVIADATADLFTALVELDRDGDISDGSSRALVMQARDLNHIDDKCLPG